MEIPQTHCRPRGQLAPINEENKIYPIGTTIKNKFNQFNHVGRIIKFGDINKWYTIEYYDGDWEEISPKEVKQYKCTINLA